MDHASIQFSPLKSIKIPSLTDRTADFVERPLGRSPRRPSPLRNESERLVWVALPTGSLYPKHKALVTPCIPIPTRLAYRPNLRPPPQIGINPSANHPVSLDGDISSKGRKVIVSRQLSVNGNIFFVVGTKFGGIVNRNPKEVPLSQILNHVSQTELQRFENQDFLEEDVREASRPPPKPMGRPIGSKLIDGRLVLAGASTGPSSAQKPQTQLSRPVVVIPSSSRAVHQVAAFAASSRTSHLAVKVLAPNVSQQVAVRVPSFNGPQPGQTRHVPETDASSESSEDELSCQRPTRRPQYAMIAASGLAPLETSQEEETSREVSVSRTASPEAAVSYNHEQSSKRRRLNTQLPLRATVPIMQPNGSNATSKSYSGKDAVVGTRARQSPPLTPMTKSDCIKYGTLDEHANKLPPMWPNPGSSRVAAQDDPFRPRNSSFPLDFDRGRYPAQRRRRRSKFYSPERTSASVAGKQSKPSVPADLVPQESPARSDVDDLDMVDMLEIRDEEAEREAILWQFQPTKIQQCRQQSSALLMPKPVIATPPRNTVSRPAASPLSAEKATVLARDIAIAINGQSQHAQPPPAPSIRVVTPEKPFQKRASLTPHYPRGVKFGPDTLSGISSRQRYETRPDHSPSKTTARTSSKTTLFTMEGNRSLDTASSSKARLSESHSNSANSRAIAKASALNSSKSPRQDSTGLTIPTKNHSSNHSNVRTKPSPHINGTAKKHQLKTPAPINDITKYFRPKPLPARAPPPPSSEDDGTESEDQLTRPSSHNPTIPLLQTRNLLHPAPAQAASDSNHASMSPLIQQPNQRTTPIRALDDESTDEALNVEVLDSQDESQEGSDSDGEDGNDYDGEKMKRSERLIHHPLIDGDMRDLGGSVEIENGFGGEGVVEDGSSETDSLGSETIVLQSRGW